MCVFICCLDYVIATALGLWNDLRNGNVNISLVLTLFCKRCVVSYVFFIFSYRFVFNQKQREHQEIIEFWNWKGADSVGFNSFVWNACSSQIIVYNISLRNRHTKKLTLANPISSKQWKSPHEINIFSLLLLYVIVILCYTSKELWFSRSIWLGPCRVLVISQNLKIFCWLIITILSTDQKWILLGTCDKT